MACFRSLYKKKKNIFTDVVFEKIASLGSGPSFHTDHMLYETHRFQTHLFESQKKPVTPETFTLVASDLRSLATNCRKDVFRRHAPAICHAGGEFYVIHVYPCYCHWDKTKNTV